MNNQSEPALATTIEEAEVNLTRAIQLSASAKQGCMILFGSTSILVVPPESYRVMADASWHVKQARDRLGALQARHRADRIMSGMARNAIPLLGDRGC